MYGNIVGRNMLCAFGHRVGMCCDMLVKFDPTPPQAAQAHKARSYSFLYERSARDIFTTDFYYYMRNVTFNYSLLFSMRLVYMRTAGRTASEKKANVRGTPRLSAAKLFSN